MSGFEYVCCQCGGPRSPLSGKRCKSCYMLNARAKNDVTILYTPRCDPKTHVPLAWLLEEEKRGNLVCTPDGFCFPEHATDEDIERFPWLQTLYEYCIIDQRDWDQKGDPPPASPSSR